MKEKAKPAAGIWCKISNKKRRRKCNRKAQDAAAVAKDLEDQQLIDVAIKKAFNEAKKEEQEHARVDEEVEIKVTTTLGQHVGHGEEEREERIRQQYREVVAIDRLINQEGGYSSYSSSCEFYSELGDDLVGYQGYEDE